MPLVYAKYPYLLAEMYAYSMAAAHEVTGQYEPRCESKTAEQWHVATESTTVYLTPHTHTHKHTHP